MVSYIQQYFNTSITILTNQVWKLLIALFKVPNTGAFTVPFTTLVLIERQGDWSKRGTFIFAFFKISYRVENVKMH